MTQNTPEGIAFGGEALSDSVQQFFVYCPGFGGIRTAEYQGIALGGDDDAAFGLIVGVAAVGTELLILKETQQQTEAA